MISEGLSALDKPARDRVLRWANAKFSNKLGDEPAVESGITNTPLMSAKPVAKPVAKPAKRAAKPKPPPPKKVTAKKVQTPKVQSPKKSKLKINQIRDLALHPDEPEQLTVKKKRVLLL